MKSLREYIREANIKDEPDTIVEGIDIDKRNKTVKLTMNHDKGVDFDIVNNPVISKFKSLSGKSYDCISIFKRTSISNSKYETDLDGNPFIYALKEKRGWTFDISKKEIKEYLMKFVRICDKSNPNEFDTILCVPSSSELNKRFMESFADILKIKNSLIDRFYKISLDEIYDYDYIDREQLKKDFGDQWEQKFDEIDEALLKMKGDYFEAKSFPKHLLKYIHYIDARSGYRDLIDNKNIIIIDDIMSTGVTLSNCVDAIEKMFIPKSITIVTLLSRKS